MFNPFSITGVDYGVNQFRDNLPGYNGNEGLDELLALSREIQLSGNYYWQGVPFPVGGATSVVGNATVNGTIQVPQGTYVTAITHYMADGASGFKFKLYDKGSKASIFYGDYAKESLASSSMTPDTNPYGGVMPFGPAYLFSPLIITDPGVLGWEVVNLSPNTQTIQVMLSLAVPINTQSIGHKIIKKVA